MQVVRFGILLIAVFVVTSSTGFAQESDYNDALKAQLKKEDTPVTPPKKVVHKKILKASASQSAKLAAQKKAMAKTVKVAQTESNVTHINIEPVQARNVQPAKDEDELAAPVLGESAVRSTQPAQVAAPQQAMPTYQPIFILQPTQGQMAAAAPAQGATQAGAAQVQPTTAVDSTTVPEPRSEQLRHQREDLEHQTEGKLIEKLEDDRLTAEKERADKLFNPQAAATPAAAPAVVAPVVVAPVAAPAPVVTAVEVAEPPPPAQVITAPAPVVPVAGSAVPATTPAPQVQVTKDESVLVAAPAISGESKSSTDPNAVKEEDIKRFSLGAVGGLPSYPAVGNVTGYYSLGAVGIYKFAEHLSLQTEFDYSKFAINNVYYCPFCFGGTLVKGMNQYDISLGLNYHPFTFGSLTPVGGLVVDFARRSYYDLVDYGYTYGTPTGSNSFNAGIMLGLDLNLSKQVILGAQFKYLWNISYWTDNPLAYGLYGPIYGNPVESLNYYMATLNIRFLF